MCDESWGLKGNTIGAVCTDAGCEPSVGANAKETNVSIVNTAAAAVTGGAGTTKVTVSATDNAVTAVKVNGNVLSASAYTIKETAENVTVVTLKDSYLKSLEVGSYTLEIESYQGNTSSTFTVAEEPVTPPPAQTGDATIIIALIATLSLAGVVFASKKRNSVK